MEYGTFLRQAIARGAPDGVGETLKKNSGHAGNIPDAHELYNALTETFTTVELFYVASEAVEQAMERMPGQIPPKPMKTHQVVTFTPGEILF